MIICGLDEVGRGSLAGPIVASAVILKPKHMLVGLADSKKLSTKQREELVPKIIHSSIVCATSWASVEEINTKGIAWANKEIFYRLIRFIEADSFVVDGNLKLNLDDKLINCVIKGDTKFDEVMAASILAKVARDELMQKLHLQNPVYGWDKNVGYGTKIHRQGIRTSGICKWHRNLFVRKILS